MTETILKYDWGTYKTSFNAAFRKYFFGLFLGFSFMALWDGLNNLVKIKGCRN